MTGPDPYKSRSDPYMSGADPYMSGADPYVTRRLREMQGSEKEKAFLLTVLCAFISVSLLGGGVLPNNGSTAFAAIALTEDGWTQITPSEDSRIIYVSSSTGDDSNDGLSEETPVKTLAKAASLMRNGYPDHMLLKCGDVWDGVGAKLGAYYRFFSGRSESEPAVLSYYGTGARPVIRFGSDGGSFIDHNGQQRSYFAIIGLDFHGYRMDPDDSGFDRNVISNPPALRFVGGGSNILVEDCRFRFAEIVVQSYGGYEYKDFQLRRCIVVDAYARGTTDYSTNIRPSGIYASGVDGLLIEECVFDRNGWNERFEDAKANMYNHNMYLQYNNVGNGVAVRGNIVARASSHGIQGRPGGLYEDNLIVQNSIGLLLGYQETELQPGTIVIARDNVILEGKLMDPVDNRNPRTAAVWGLDVYNVQQASVTIERNIVANRRDNGSNMGIKSNPQVVYVDNIQHKWGGGIGDMNNPAWPDPNRSVGSYHGTLGKEPTLEAFLEMVRNRGLREWPQEYTAYAVNEYIREGFGMNE